MRRVSISIILLLALLSAKAQDFSISQSERNFLLNFLQVSEDEILSSISSLSEEQWKETPDSESWSAAQCMSHILQAEQGLFKNIQMLLQGPANYTEDLSPQDAWLIGKIADRGVKVKTPLPEQPEIMTKEEAIQALENSRNNIRKFLQDSTLPLRAHVGKSPFGPADCYQLFLVIAAHGLRHKAQIDEILRKM